MGRRAADGRTGLTARLVLAGALLATGVACGDDRPGSSIPAEGVILATGPGASWNLLSVPRDGGSAGLVEFAPAPGDSAPWQGTASLPSSVRVHRVGNRHLVLLLSDGRVERYDPVRDLTSRVGETDPSALWAAHDRWGLFRVEGASTLLEVAAGGAWSYRLQRPPSWAAPASEGDVVAILPSTGSDPGGLVRFDRGGADPAARLDGDFVPPAVVTGFGGQVAAVRRGAGGGGWELVLVGLPEMEEVATLELPARPDALATSPSSHELYVALGDRLLVVGRSGLDRRNERSLPAPVQELRPGLLGGPVLASSDQAAFLLPWDDGPRRLETEWRADLPISLPDGSVLAVRGGSVVRVGTGGEAADTLGAADRWWIPVRWALLEDRPRVAATDTAGPGGVEGAGGEAGSPDADAAAASDTMAPEPGEDVPVAGFYAVVVAARDRTGVERLLGELRADGWRTDIHEWRDDAGRTWHRGLVGPFDTRPEAEQAARELQRERDLSVWVKELGPGPGGER